MPRRGSALFATLGALGALVVAAWAGAARADEPKRATTPAGALFEALVRQRLLDPSTGSQDTLKEELARAEAMLERGDMGAAAAALYAIVESPRFTDFSDHIAYQNAEYDLIVALAAGGAQEEALGYVDRVLARGVKSPYFSVAQRRAVDVALATREYAAVLARLEKIKLDGELRPEAAGERTYLAGRAAYEARDYLKAEQLFATVSKRSRLYSSAVYLRGVIRVRQRNLKEATEAFCTIAHSHDADKTTFFIDDRYYGLKDLARLGAGRIAHEERRFDDAYYHYFQIPDDSDRLPEALFEAAWSMYSKRELRTARQLVNELVLAFPATPLRSEALLLAGYIELADCKFDAARKRFDDLTADTTPLLGVVDAAQAQAALRRQLLTKALSRVTSRGPNAAAPPLSSHPRDRVLGMLRVDPKLVRLNDSLAGLRLEASLSAHAVTAWRNLLTRPDVKKAAIPVQEEARLAAAFLADVRRLREDARRQRAGGKVDAELGALEEKARAASATADQRITDKEGPGLHATLARELASAGELAARARAMADRFDSAADEVAKQELARLRATLVRIGEKARLGKADAVIGEKKKLEKEIEEIANDKWVPPDLRRAYQRGMIGEDEEYWPLEDEVWEDEFSGWR